MTRRDQQSRAPEQTPTTFRLTSAFRMKSRYQRHMLYAMVLAALVVCLPTIIVAFWPVPPTITIDPRDIDSLPPGGYIKIEWTKGPVSRKPPPLIPPAERLRGRGPGQGNLVDNIVLIDDTVQFVDDGLALGGGGAGYGDPVTDDYDIFAPAGGGVDYVSDTNTYGLFEELDQPPELINMPLPEYPAVARRTRMEGKVILHLLVDLDGRVKDVRVFTETNPSLPFARSAIDAALKAVFRPAFHRGVPVRCWVSIPVEFELR